MGFVDVDLVGDVDVDIDGDGDGDVEVDATIDAQIISASVTRGSKAARSCLTQPP